MTNFFYFHISAFRVLCPVLCMVVFCNYLLSCFAGILISDILWRTFRWFNLSLILMVSLLFCIPHALYFCFLASKLFSQFLGLFLCHISFSWNCSLWTATLLCNYHNYIARFIFRNGCHFSFLHSIIRLPYNHNLF